MKKLILTLVLESASVLMVGALVFGLVVGIALLYKHHLNTECISGFGAMSGGCMLPEQSGARQ